MNLSAEALEILTDLNKVYMTNREYFIKAEDIIENMGFFTAPLVEHRDALDHIMRFFGDENLDNINQLKSALSHEMRAFFDVADYICINIRQEIYKGLNDINARDITEVWGNYLECKQKVVKLSFEIAEIRNNRDIGQESLNKYKNELDKLFELYKEYQIYIAPRLKLKKGGRHHEPPYYINIGTRA